MSSESQWSRMGHGSPYNCRPGLLDALQLKHNTCRGVLSSGGDYQCSDTLLPRGRPGLQRRAYTTYTEQIVINNSQERTHLLAYGRYVRELGLVVKVGEALHSDHAIECSVRFRLNLWIENHGEDDREGGRPCLCEGQVPLFIVFVAAHSLGRRCGSAK